MNKRINQIMQSYFINKKLNMFPSANDYVYLSTVFPEKYKNSDKIVPVRYDSDGSIEKIFEEKDVTGVVETKIIPIEYHSSYGAGIAEEIEKLILKNPKFFSVFLSRFEKIVIDSNGSLENNVFVVDNFTRDFSYTINDFMDCVLSNYCVDDEYRDLLVPKIINSFSEEDKNASINYYFYLNSHGDEYVDFSCLVDLFLIERDYESLKLLFDTGNIMEVRDKYIKKNCFRIINSILNSPNYVPSFLIKYIDLLKDAYINTNNSSLLVPFSDKGFSLHRIEKNSTFNLVRFLLSKFDSTGKFNEVFDQGILKRDILLWYKDEEEFLKKTFGEFPVKRENFVGFEVSGTIGDTVKLVREFMRYYVCRNGIRDEERYLLDVLPSYYEEKTKVWLKNNGFSSSEVMDSTKDAISNDVLVMLDLVQKKKNDGQISDDNLEVDQAVSCAKLLIKSPVLKCDKESISKAFGKYLASNYMNDDMDQRMLVVAESLSNKENKVDDMIGVIASGVKTSKSNISTIQYVKIKIPPTVVLN